METPKILKQQTAEFNQRQFYCQYEELSWQQQTLRHIGEHIAKAGLKLIETTRKDQSSDIIIQQVIPDLAIYRSQILELTRLEVEEINWIEDNPQRDEMDALENIAEAYGLICKYIEPAEHSTQNKDQSLLKEVLLDVPSKLHLAATILARIYNVDLVDSQLKRMQALINN